MRSRKWWGVWAVVLAWATLGMPATADPAEKQPETSAPAQAAAKQIDIETEIGRIAARDLEKRYGVYTDAAANARVTRLGGMMARASASASAFQFGVLKSDEPNGVSLPGGFIYVTRGLVRLLPEDDLLAAALGHEVAHIALGHMAELLRQQSGQDSPPAARAGNGALESPDRVRDPFAPIPDRKPQDTPMHAREKAADRASARYLLSVGIDPRSMLLLLQRLSRQPELNAVGSATHPTWPDRIHCLDEYLKSAEFQALVKAPPVGPILRPMTSASPLPAGP